MGTYNIDLNKLVNSNVDLISGRSYGESEAGKFQILDHIKNHDKMVILIDDQVVKAINDSFIKGFFSDVFMLLKTKDRVKGYFEVKANEYFVRLFEKNWTILEALYADAVIASN